MGMPQPVALEEEFLKNEGRLMATAHADPVRGSVQL